MKVDVAVVGAGIVGLATAHEILQKNPHLSVVIFEKERGPAEHQTGHNSGVIHSGVYYKPGSEKAKSCLHGYRRLLDFCTKHQVKHEITGKLIVASNEKELPALHELRKRGESLGLEGLKILDREQALAIEPNIECLQALHVPQAGVVDYREVALALENEVKRLGAKIYYRHTVMAISSRANGFRLKTPRGEFVAEKLVTCGGLYSDLLAEMTDQPLDIRIIPFRGEYYTICPEKQSLVKSLVYPVPDFDMPFLGVHFTRTISGAVEAGPNAVLAFQREGYKKSDFNFSETLRTFTWLGFLKVSLRYWRVALTEWRRSRNKKLFVQSLKKLIPAIDTKDLRPGGSGVRAQACTRDGRLLDDFYLIKGKNYVHVCNAPSPAATSCLAIGETIVEKLLIEADG